MTKRRIVRHCALVAASAALSGGIVAVLSPGGVGAQSAPPPTQPPLPSGCAAPYRASFAAVTYPVAAPVVLPWAGGTVLDHQAGALDTDGDGTADTVTDLADNAFRVTRASGSLELPAKTFLANRDDAVDLDGDGRSDLVVAADPAGPTPGTYLVPGATADGPVDLATEAIRLPDHLGNVRGIGDQDGDGSDDVAANTAIDGRGDTDVFSGAELAAPGPGGTADPDPLATYPGPLVGLAAFDADRPTLITSAGASGATIVLQGDPAVELSVRSDPSLPGIDPESTNATAVADGDDLWIVLSHLDRSGSQVWGWNLVDLCAGPASAPAPITPPAAPAAPLAGSADYTG
ncbi:MAG: hypothetical protein JWM47_1894 [Acidimicrobiales bacterium]|nr:hypothetical protein [Acidimicrobiales bacterium]